MNERSMLLTEDSLRELNENTPLSQKLSFLHGRLRHRCPFVDRVAVALYDVKTDFVKTFIQSGDKPSPLVHYQARLSEVPSLHQLVKARCPRVINNFSMYPQSGRVHSLRLQDFGASYTLPLYTNDRFFGFVFFNSLQRDVFHGDNLHYLDLFGHLLGLVIINEITNAETLTAAIKTTAEITQQRDPETGNHLERMARYARIIALNLPDEYGLSDEFIEHLFLFAPLHDVGKVGIPDAILLKKGRLTREEYEVMKGHARKGRQIIDTILENFHLGAVSYKDMLRNIAEYHHEAVNGGGYPHGLCGEEIPIEARIVAVADVFDALTTGRPYKEAWDNDRAFATLHESAGTKLDRDCVNALTRHQAEVEEIQRVFAENAPVDP